MSEPVTASWSILLAREYWPEIWDGTLDTLVMTGLSLLFTVLLGLPLGVALFLTGAYLRVLEAEDSSPSPFSGGFVAAGSVKWHSGGVKHEVVNIGETALGAMLVHLSES